MRVPCQIITLFLSCFLFLGCSTLKENKDGPPPLEDVQLKPLTPEESKEMLGTLGEDYIYGPGLGETALAAGGVILFPPYALVLLGNAALSLSGYDTIGVGTLLPEKEEKAWDSMYDGVVSVPGRVTSGIADTPYRTREDVNNHLKLYLTSKHQKSEEDQHGQ